MNRTQIYLPKSHLDELRKIAQRRKVTVSEVVRGFVDEKLQKPKRPLKKHESLLEAELLRLKNKNSRNEESTNETSLNESRFRQQILQEKRQNTLLKGKLDEYRGAIETLRDQLNEMNLFNAKLLYVNKLLQTKGLDSSQKKTIIESIDNAESLREVKLVYKTLSESVVKTPTNSLNESKIRKRR